MSKVMDVGRPPLGVRMLQGLGTEPDWTRMTDDDVVALRDRVNRKRSSPLARVISGLPDRGSTIRWQEVALADRTVRVRVYRPSRGSVDGGANGGDLPLVLHVHGGGFVGTAVQSDWINSHLAARLPALVVSVEHRLIGPETTLSAALDDAEGVLWHVVGDAAAWGVDPERAAVFGESAGGMVTALVAIRARRRGLALRAQVLANPAVDLTSTAFEHDSVKQHGDSPTLSLPQMLLFQRLAVPPGEDARAVSPLHAEDLSGLAPALVVVPTLDPLADHGRCYARRLKAAGTPALLTEYPGATHGFLSMPRLVPQAKAARSEILGFLQGALAG